MKLEWDEAKRRRTLAERGLDFADVATLDWQKSLTLEDDRSLYPELRYITVGPLKDRVCVLVWCYRDDALRVISLRKANEREKRRYEQAIHRP